MINKNIIILLPKFNSYGITAPFAAHANDFLPNLSLKYFESKILQIFVLRFFRKYISTQGSSLNRFFTFLTICKKSYNLDQGNFNFFLYNNQAVLLFRSSVSALVNQLGQARKILFIVDKKTEQDFRLRKLNFLLWPKILYPQLEQWAELEYYYNDWAKSKFESFPSIKDGLDFVVFCARDYTRVSQPTFRKIGRVTAGVCVSSTRPDLFDYSLPVSVSYAFTLNWIVALVLLHANHNKLFK